MKKLTLSFAMVAMVGVTHAALILNLVPDGDFEALDDSPFWTQDGPATITYPDAGGNGGGGYASMDEAGGGWGVLVNPTTPGAVGGGVSVASLNVTPGLAYDFQQDMKNFSGTGNGGLKIEAWAGNALIGNSGDMFASANSTEWATYQFNWTVPVGTEKLIFVPLWGAGSNVGFDNVGVMAVPEPATLGLIGLFGGGMLFLRRLRRF